MVITWDDKKNDANIKKHGVAFEDAVSVVLNPLSLFNLNPHPDEIRYQYLGFSDNSLLLYVVTVEASDQAIRIISARGATKKERHTYEEGI